VAKFIETRHWIDESKISCLIYQKKSMKLHNVCLDRNLSVPLQRFYEDVQEDDEWVVLGNA
jgi:hypothetical protein